MHICYYKTPLFGTYQLDFWQDTLPVEFCFRLLFASTEAGRNRDLDFVNVIN